MGSMTGSAILCSRRMQSAVTPILSHFAMTAETKCRLAFTLICSMGRTMAAVTGNALPFCHRFMLDLVLADLGFNFRMAIEANLPRLILDEIGLIGAMRAVT